MGPVDYGWEGGGLANELNWDAQLRKMLIKAKVPVITNHLQDLVTTSASFITIRNQGRVLTPLP